MRPIKSIHFTKDVTRCFYSVFSLPFFNNGHNNIDKNFLIHSIYLQLAAMCHLLNANNVVSLQYRNVRVIL